MKLPFKLIKTELSRREIIILSSVVVAYILLVFLVLLSPTQSSLNKSCRKRFGISSVFDQRLQGCLSTKECSFNKY